MNNIFLDDKNERRKDNDRRQFAYTFHLPERRDGSDRRDEKDRRKNNRPAEGE